MNVSFPTALLLSLFLVLTTASAVEPPPVVEVDGQPLAANAQRLMQALEFVGAPLPEDAREAVAAAATARDARKLQELLDPYVLCVVSINPELRVKVARGPAKAQLQQEGYTPVLVKVINDGIAARPLRIKSPQSGPVYAGTSKGTMERERQQWLRENENVTGRTDRFLQVEMMTSAPMTADLSGFGVEYAIALIYSAEAGKREATIAFDIGEGTQDLGFRAELPVLFDVNPARTVTLAISDFDGKPTTGRFVFLDHLGRVHPPQPKRLSPDFFFQKHIYRDSGATVTLPPGEFTMSYGRGPEYRWQEKKITIPADGPAEVAVKLERWINPADFGFYCGDHHIHAAGCAHYTSPHIGMEPEHMFRQVKGEGLHVGCVLHWGYGFDHQRQFFGGASHPVSEPMTLLRYDMEVSGFGSAALGHICLLNLRDLVYPGADGIKGWPTWTTPTLRWTKQQGGYTGYPHSGSGMQVVPATAAKRMMELNDANKDGRLTREEVAGTVLPEPFEKIDADLDRGLNEHELLNSHDRVVDLLPNVAIPDAGGHEIFVSTAHGVCDFISAMDTARLLEWNCWYHLMNCGFPLKCSGETDFPCMSGTRVGQGRVYVQLGRGVEKIDFPKWCEGLAKGRSYVSDGYAHALAFSVDGKTYGEDVTLAQPGKVKVQAKLAFGSETPLEVAYGGAVPVGGARLIGDTVHYHDTTGAQPFAGGKRKIELVVNGQVVAVREVLADDQPHDLGFTIDITRSSWVGLRHFPQLHTNPVNVIVAGQPIRASRQSALWCIACIDQLWRVRQKNIAPAEQAEARKTFDEAKEIYRRIAAEAPREAEYPLIWNSMRTFRMVFGDRRAICLLFLWVISFAPTGFCAPLNPAMDPKNIVPPQFANAENHTQERFLPESRDWERMDIYVPKSGKTVAREALPCVLLIYGGGWRGKVTFSKENIQVLLDNGYVVAVPDYVLTAQKPVPMAVWDGAAAVRFLRANAGRYRIDSERIGAIGLSAGGWLLQHLCVADSRTVVSVAQTKKGQPSSPVPILEPHPAHESFSAELTAFVVDWGANQLATFKAGILTPDDPPMFTVHHDKDGRWPPGAKAYVDAGAKAEVAFVEVIDTHAVVGVHTRAPTPSRDESGQELPLGQRTLEYLDKYVKNPTITSAPEILPHGGPISEPAQVVLRSVHPSAKIHFTVDGSPPSESSPVYTQPIEVAPGKTLKAMAIKPGLAPSSVASATFTTGRFAWPVITTKEMAFEGKVGQPFTTIFEAHSSVPVTWHMCGKVSPVSDSGSPQAPMPALEIDPASGKITGTAEGPGVAVFIVTAGFQDGGTFLYDSRSVTVTFK